MGGLAGESCRDHGVLTDVAAVVARRVRHGLGKGDGGLEDRQAGAGMDLGLYDGACCLRELDVVAEAGEGRGRHGDAIDEHVEGDGRAGAHLDAVVNGAEAGGGVAFTLAVGVGAVDAVAEATVVDAVVTGLADVVLTALHASADPCGAGVGGVHVEAHHHVAGAGAVSSFGFVAAALERQERDKS